MHCGTWSPTAQPPVAPCWSSAPPRGWPSWEWRPGGWWDGWTYHQKWWVDGWVFFLKFIMNLFLNLCFWDILWTLVMSLGIFSINTCEVAYLARWTSMYIEKFQLFLLFTRGTRTYRTGGRGWAKDFQPLKLKILTLDSGFLVELGTGDQPRN